MLIPFRQISQIGVFPDQERLKVAQLLMTEASGCANIHRSTYNTSSCTTQTTLRDEFGNITGYVDSGSWSDSIIKQLRIQLRQQLEHY